MSFVEVDIVTDPDAIADTAVTYLQDNLDGWTPAEGNIEMWLIEATARQTAEAAEVARRVPPAIFRGFGFELLGITPVQGANAQITTAWTMQDEAGWTVPAGTVVAYRRSADDATLFETTADVTVPTGYDHIGGIVLTARDEGTASNGVPIGELECVDALRYVESVVATSASSGGEDPETDAAYLSRLVAEFRLMSPRPILPNDFAVLAGRVEGVGRALALNLYNPDDDTDDNERYVTVALADVEGAACSTPLKAAVVALLDAMREVNFVVKAMDPTYTDVDVAYTVHVLDGYDEATVLAAIDARLADWLSPAKYAGGDQDPPVWLPGVVKVRYLQTADVISDVPGVDYVGSCTINGGTADVTLTGRAPLPTPGTIGGTVV